MSKLKGLLPFFLANVVLSTSFHSAAATLHPTSFIPSLSSLTLENIDLSIELTEDKVQFKDHCLSCVNENNFIWSQIAERISVPFKDLQKSTAPFKEKFNNPLTCKELVLGAILWRYIAQNLHQFEPATALSLIKTSADLGSECAITRLLVAYRDGEFGLNEYSKEVQKVGLQLAKLYAESGSESAIAILLGAYRDGGQLYRTPGFGVKSYKEEVMLQGLELARKYAESRSRAARFFLALTGRYTDPNDLQIGNTFLGKRPRNDIDPPY